MGVPSWLEDADLWDEIYVHDAYFGETKVDIEGEFGNDFDVKKAPGADGAPNTNKGYDPWRPKVSWVIYSEEHWTQYQMLLALVQPKPGKMSPPIVRLVHPIFDLYKKSRFKITKLHALKYLGQSQWLAQLDLLEHFDAPKSVPKPKVKTLTKAEQEIDQKLEQAVLERERNRPSNSASGPGLLFDHWKRR